MTQRVVYSTTGTASLTDGPTGPGSLGAVIVIDWILASGTTSSALVLALSVDGNTVAQKTVSTASDYIYLDFANGYPVWSASDTDAVPAASVDVVLTGPTSASTLAVGYHWALASQIRN